MLRSMFSAVSGLRSHQTMMDVTGNNIANVNTAGFKASRTTFQETLSQVVRGGNGGGAAQGGVNPMQIGLGTQVAATDQVFTQGAAQATGRATDLAIQGDGFFAVESNGQPAFTRGGAFSFDDQGDLVTSRGDRVLDTNGAPINVAIGQYSEISIAQNGAISGRDVNTQQVVGLGTIGLATFPNPEGLARGGNGLFVETPASGGAALLEPGTGGAGVLQSGTLEMSNVDLAQEFTNLILSQRGFQANARTITTSDELLQEVVNLKR